MKALLTTAGVVVVIVIVVLIYRPCTLAVGFMESYVGATFNCDDDGCKPRDLNVRNTGFMDGTDVEGANANGGARVRISRARVNTGCNVIVDGEATASVESNFFTGSDATNITIQLFDSDRKPLFGAVALNRIEVQDCQVVSAFSRETRIGATPVEHMVAARNAAEVELTSVAGARLNKCTE